ncbi:MAG: type II secretion system protein M [Desulfobacterales bacterium]|nr:type II secretion system protein M [Desulfobacterales bacterium]
MKKLSRREKYSIYSAVAALFIFIILQVVISPFFEKRASMKRSLQAGSVMLDEMIQLKAEYEDLKTNSELSIKSISKREKNFTLFSFLDREAGEANIKDNITYMRPSTKNDQTGQYKISMVELKIQSLTMKQLVAYLYRVESSKNMVTIKRISITRQNTTEGLIDVVLQVAAASV